MHLTHSGTQTAGASKDADALAPVVGRAANGFLQRVADLEGVLEAVGQLEAIPGPEVAGDVLDVRGSHHSNDTLSA